LQRLMSCVLDMTDDCKKHFRQKTRDILDKLVRKFGFEVILGQVPSEDTITHKRLKNLHKIQARQKRERENRRAAKAAEDEDDEEYQVREKH